VEHDSKEGEGFVVFPDGVNAMGKFGETTEVLLFARGGTRTQRAAKSASSSSAGYKGGVSIMITS
jgi:hypothetical protein